jgi:hypothetical protein
MNRRIIPHAGKKIEIIISPVVKCLKRFFILLFCVLVNMRILLSIFFKVGLGFELTLAR